MCGGAACPLSRRSRACDAISLGAGYPRWFTIGAEKMNLEYYTRKAFEAASHVIPETVMAQRDKVWPAAMRALAVHEGEGQGLIHSDVHIGNWYRTAAGKMGLCDWQCLSRGHWSRDFAYAVTAALTPADRRMWEKDLLARYLERFAELTAQSLISTRASDITGSKWCTRS
jgi:aminoglycoside phosphotransferase (APT) family kinase protein